MIHILWPSFLALGLLGACVLLGPSALGAEVAADLPQTCYLFASFRDNGQDGLHLAWSKDGLEWTALNGDKSFLKPSAGRDKLMRDPFILQGPDGTFHMVWTSSWKERNIGYASSKDLIHWSPQKTLPVMEHEPNARNCWAPEMAYDPAGKQFIIFWATCIPGRFPETDAKGDEGLNHRMYCTTTKDFVTFSPTQLFYDPGFSVIDATMLQHDGQYHLVIKDETRHPPKKHLRVASGQSITGPFPQLGEPFSPAWVEGPSALKVGEWWIVYYDLYTRGRYGAMRSKDLVNWEDVTPRVSFPRGTRHGTAFAVERKFLHTLLSHSP